MTPEEQQAQYEAKKKALLEKYPDCPISEPIECLSLIMRKEYAEAILRGEKKVEFRDYTEFYCRRIFDKKVMDYGNTKVAEEDIQDFVAVAGPLRIVKKIHFHPYNNSWWLDVEVIDNYTAVPCKDDADYLFENYGDTELRALAEDCDRHKLTERPIFFFFALGKVLDTNL